MNFLWMMVSVLQMGHKWKKKQTWFHIFIVPDGGFSSNRAESLRAKEKKEPGSALDSEISVRMS